MNCKMWIILLLIFLSGCATQGVNTREHTDVQLTKIKNEIVIPRTQSETWDMLVKHLSKSFYVINNIDKASRIINVSFSSTSPEDYIDCGKTRRTYTQGNNTEVFDYETAASSRFKHATPKQPHPAFAYYVKVIRETSLEGRSNIYVAPNGKDPNSTVVSVNTRYIWNLKIKGLAVQEHANGNIVSSHSLPEETSTIMFNTNQSGQRMVGGIGEVITCISKGTLEREILSMVGEEKSNTITQTQNAEIKTIQIPSETQMGYKERSTTTVSAPTASKSKNKSGYQLIDIQKHMKDK